MGKWRGYKGNAGNLQGELRANEKQGKMGILEETSGIFGPGKGWSGDGVEQEQIWKGGLQRRCGAGGVGSKWNF